MPGLHGVFHCVQQPGKRHGLRQRFHSFSDGEGALRLAKEITGNALCMLHQRLHRGFHIAAVSGLHRRFESAHQVHRLIAADGYIDGVGQHVVGEGVDFARRHAANESLDKRPHRFRRAVAQQPLQFRHVNRRVPVQRCGVIFHRTQMAGSRVILGRAVVYGGKIVVFVMDGVR